MIVIALLAAPLALTSVEFCASAPEPPATEPPEWHWRMVDGKKCYFRAANEADDKSNRDRIGSYCKERAAIHSMTSSARASSMDGRSRPNALAVLRLMTSWYLDACSTGRSAGLLPLRILSI
jgi:hypothetical protein